MANPSGTATAWRVRRARDANVEEINRVIVASKSHWDYPRSYLEAALPLLVIDESYLAEHLCFEVVDEAANVVCFFAVTEDTGEHRLDHLWVRPDRLRRGIGRRACEHVFALARRYRWPVLLVLADPPAHGFYRRMGFEDTDMRVPSRVPNGPAFPVLQKHFDDGDEGKVAGLGSSRGETCSAGARAVRPRPSRSPRGRQYPPGGSACRQRHPASAAQSGA
jgi:GNAT superfamily N-acetyltransferase